MLGFMYVLGRGVLEDKIQAYAWLNIAGTNGFKKSNRAQSTLKLTQDSIEKAQALSRKMVEENPRMLGD
jgi:TPR repeat protein